MVLIKLKISEKNQFIFECTGDMSVDDIFKNLIAISNFRIRIDELAVAVEALMNHGPLRPEDVRGLKDTADLEPDIEYTLKQRQVQSA